MGCCSERKIVYKKNYKLNILYQDRIELLIYNTKNHPKRPLLNFKLIDRQIARQTDVAEPLAESFYDDKILTKNNEIQLKYYLY
jgi:hypothetical protein